MPQDSVNRPIKVGDRVRFRGEVYTIKEFHPGKGLYGTANIIFEEPQQTPEIANETSVDLVEAS